MSSLFMLSSFYSALIERHRSSAINMVNTEALQMNWEIGQFISKQLQSSYWGTKVVSDLADYLKKQRPRRRGFSKRNLYNMVKFFELYSNQKFLQSIKELNIDAIVQLPTAQLEYSTACHFPHVLAHTLNRSLSPTMVAEYQRKLIPQEVMRKSLEEYCSFLKSDK